MIEGLIALFGRRTVLRSAFSLPLAAAAVAGIWLMSPTTPTDARTKLRPATTVATCADPIANVLGNDGSGAPGVVTATDALFVLKAAVGLSPCELCVCDINGSGAITAADALGTLASATGQSIALNCPPCDMTSTTSTTCPSAEPAETGLNFGVTGDSVGVPGSDVAAESAVGEHPADLFTSTGSGEHAAATAGNNTLSVEDVDLGLATDAELDAVSFGGYVTGPYTYFFSLRDSTRVAGLEDTAVRDEYDNEVVPGDIYSSPGQPGAAAGTNTLSRDEIALGLEPHDLASDPTDDLDALDFGSPDGPYYLSVASTGGSGGADIMRSLGGATSQALSAADIGLLDSDEVDALVVQDVDGDLQFSSGDYILFSVSLASAGTASSAVRAQAVLGEAAGDIFVSTGDGTNALAVDENDLGLRPADDIDALEIQRSGFATCGCGDGVLVAPEECEVGVPCAAAAAGAICDLSDCTCDELFCGDGIKTFPEQCEPGGVAPCPAGFTCNPACKCVKLKNCWDGNLDPGEQCENGSPCPMMGDICNPLTCQCSSNPFCGDGNLDFLLGEACDPPGSLCNPNETCNRLTCECIPEGVYSCGNGIVDGGEDCDPWATPTGCNESQICTQSCECADWGCIPNGEHEPGLGEECDPFANPSGCQVPDDPGVTGISCTSSCQCGLVTPHCGDGVFTPGPSMEDEECDFVMAGGMSMDVGCDPGQMCNRSTCRCAACIDPDPQNVDVITYNNFAIPVCQLILAGPDACPEDHYHGFGYGVSLVGEGVSMVIDPNPPGCGYGSVTERPVTSFEIGGEIACELVSLGLSCGLQLPTP